MNFYWVYDLPTWLFAMLTIAVTVAVGLAGLFATRKWVRRIHGDDHSHNDVVGFYLGAVCVFYGITLGLLRTAGGRHLAKFYRCRNQGWRRGGRCRCSLSGCERFS